MMGQYNKFSVNEWLEFLENRHQQEIQLGLNRIQQVAEVLDLIKPNAKVITVGGTNGKGSTVATLEAIYSAAGYQVAVYTSPHLLSFNERIRVNKKNISDEELCAAFSVIEEGRGEIHLTYFEMTTLAALWHFKQEYLDLIILEVGLGGRLDATNIISADLAIVTTIDLDHQDYLGETIEEIAFEKAGILRTNKPFIYADQDPPLSIIKEAQRLKSPMFLLSQDYQYQLNDDRLEFRFQEKQISLPKPRLHANSVSAAIMASILLETSLKIDYSHWKQAISDVDLTGRLQWVEGPVRTLFDVSHNPQAVCYLAEFIRNEAKSKKQCIHAVFSALKDKDLSGILAPLQDCITHWYPSLLKIKRAASKEQLTKAFSSFGQVPVFYQDPVSAYQAACQQANRGDLIVVYGSFVTVAEVMHTLNAEER